MKFTSLRYLTKEEAQDQPASRRTPVLEAREKISTKVVRDIEPNTEYGKWLSDYQSRNPHSHHKITDLQ